MDRLFKRGKPAVDSALSSRLGATRGGQPLSYNRAPAADIAPWVGRLYAAVVDMPQEYQLACGLFYDAPVVRLQLRGDWTADTADGPRAMGRAALMFGAQTRYMPVSVKGSFTSVGFSLRPGTGHALFGWNARDYLDRFVPCDEIGLPGGANSCPAGSVGHTGGLAFHLRIGNPHYCQLQGLCAARSDNRAF